LSDRVDLRLVPELDFRVDPAIQAGARIDQLLAEIGPLPPEQPTRADRDRVDEA
jgi:hypothetical protein